MICPLDQTELQSARLRGIEVERCPACKGEWLEHAELAELEDQVFPEGVPKGTVHFGDHPSGRSCPHCSEEMTRFRYRGWPLELERCPSDAGYWLDDGEEKRIRDFMNERKSRLGRSASAERLWHAARTNRGRGLLERLKDLFR